jgi:hypothetical protein
MLHTDKVLKLIKENLSHVLVQKWHAIIKKCVR